MKLHVLLKKRALRFLEEAERDLSEGYYDLASFHAEQALQLFIKALLARMGISERRTHEIRELLAELFMSLQAIGRHELAEKIMEFVRNRRASLAALEEAYYEARYKPYPYTKEEAEELVEVAKEGIKVLSEIEKEVFK